jgi:aldehyde dehydrogenase (NAD+)
MKDTLAVENTSLAKQTTVFQSQKAFFNSQATKSYDFRKAQLLKVKEMIKAHEQDIMSALSKDLANPILRLM